MQMAEDQAAPMETISGASLFKSTAGLNTYTTIFECRDLLIIRTKKVFGSENSKKSGYEFLEVALCGALTPSKHIAKEVAKMASVGFGW